MPRPPPIQCRSSTTTPWRICGADAANARRAKNFPAQNNVLRWFFFRALCGVTGHPCSKLTLFLATNDRDRRALPQRCRLRAFCCSQPIHSTLASRSR
jgi:hypothetical protein